MQFVSKKVKYLGHIVSENGINHVLVKSIKDWLIPCNVNDLRSFLGTISYYRRFVKGFVDIAKVLHKFTEKAASFLWTNECDIAFQRLKTALITNL